MYSKAIMNAVDQKSHSYVPYSHFLSLSGEVLQQINHPRSTTWPLQCIQKGATLRFAAFNKVWKGHYMYMFQFLICDAVVCLAPLSTKPLALTGLQRQGTLDLQKVQRTLVSVHRLKTWYLSIPRIEILKTSNQTEAVAQSHEKWCANAQTRCWPQGLGQMVRRLYFAG